MKAKVGDIIYYIANDSVHKDIISSLTDKKDGPILYNTNRCANLNSWEIHPNELEAYKALHERITIRKSNCAHKLLDLDRIINAFTTIKSLTSNA